MLTIGRLAKLFGISEQTVRMYEKYRLLDTQRDPQNGYRKFDLASFTDLIKTRALLSMGFNMKDVSLLMGNCEANEAKRLMREKTESMQHEIERLESQKRYLERMMRQIDEIETKQGCCEVVREEGWYIQPVLDGKGNLTENRDDALGPWNEYAFVRQDINLLDTQNGWKEQICFAVRESEAVLYGLDRIGADYYPPRSYVKAYYITESENCTAYAQNLRFALEEVERRGMRVNGKIMLLLPYTSGSRKGRYYHTALIPIDF